MSILSSTGNFCPFCQLPLNLIKNKNLNLHLEVCSRKQKSYQLLKECPKGINCDSTMICHYERYSHLMLANKRANCNNNNPPSCSSINSKSCKNVLEAEGYSSEDFVPITVPKRQKLNKSIVKRLNRHHSENSMSFSKKNFLNTSQNFHVSQGINLSSNKDITKTASNEIKSATAGQNSEEKNGHSFNRDNNNKTEIIPSSLKIENNDNKKSNFTKKDSPNNINKRQKQADIGAMLFGLKPKVVQENTKPKEEELTNSSSFSFHKKSCPFYKKVDGTDIAVDAFSYGLIPGINYYFLSHFHYDHYMGLNKKFYAEIYCSKITGNLLQTRLSIQDEKIKRLPMNEKILVGNAFVTLFEANHCPGAVLFLFQLKNGRAILHTGDFRADSVLRKNITTIDTKIDLIYLDTTYLDPTYTFPPQDDVVQFVSDNVEKILARNSKTLVVTGAYCIGKERIFMDIARKLGVKICVSNDKLRVLKCLDDDEMISMVTTDVAKTNLHVLPMNKLNPSNLNKYLEHFNDCYDQLVAVKPTGWTYKGVSSKLDQLKPSFFGKVLIYAVPYSEHSSFLELKQFIELLKPNRVIPTVNVGKVETRRTMESYLNTWKK